jgi:hypothetical protein
VSEGTIIIASKTDIACRGLVVCRVKRCAVGRWQFGDRLAGNRSGISQRGTLRAERRCDVSHMVVLRLEHCVGDLALRSVFGGAASPAADRTGQALERG